MSKGCCQEKYGKQTDVLASGDTAYLVHSNRFIKEVTVLSVDAYGMCSVRFNDANGGIKVRRSKLHRTKEDAEKMLSMSRHHNFPV